MDQEKAIQFIRRIVETSPDSYTAKLALDQLRLVLGDRLDGEALEALDTVCAGVLASLPEMQQVGALSTMEDIRAATQRAKDRKLREDMAARQGRC